MRTTLYLGRVTHAKLVDRAKTEKKTLSVLADSLLYDALFPPDLPDNMHIDPITGLAKIDFGRTFTPDEIAELLDEDD